MSVRQDNRSASLECSVHTEPSPQWCGFVGAHARATVYDDQRWGLLMRQVYGNSVYYLSASLGGQIVGTLQLVLQKSMLLGRRLCSLPYLDASGILTADDQAAGALLERSRELVAQTKARWAELRQYGPLAEQDTCSTKKVTLRLELPDKEESLWQLIGSKPRNLVRKAQSLKLEVKEGQEELLGDFFDVYSRTMRDLGSPSHSRRFFKALLDSFGQVARLYVVRQGAAVLAASLTLRHQGVVYLPWAGNDWRHRSTNANMLLYWSMLADACKGSMTLFDFGRSTPGGGTYKFKKQWGAQDLPLHWHYLQADGSHAAMADNSKLALAQSCWKHLPLGLARLLGPHLIRSLS